MATPAPSPSVPAASTTPRSAPRSRPTWPTIWTPAFKSIGYTEEGSEFSYEMSSDPVEVAESLDPVFYRTTGRNGGLTFAMAENTVRNLTLAFNGGTVTRTTSGAVKYSPPEPGTEVRRILVWESEDGEERWVYPQVFQGGSVSMARRKGADEGDHPGRLPPGEARPRRHRPSTSTTPTSATAAPAWPPPPDPLAPPSPQGLPALT